MLTATAIISDPMTETSQKKQLGYLDYRCPICKGDSCGNDANAGWDVVTQQSTLLSEFDQQWCNECGDVTLEEFTVTDPAEIARIDAERAKLRVMDAAEELFSAARHALQLLSGAGPLSPEAQSEVRDRLTYAVMLGQGHKVACTEAMLVLSTRHLQHDTCTEWLDTAPFAAYTKADHGWFVFVPEDLDEHAMPAELLACCRLAHAQGCEWIMYDSDAPALDTLPVFDW